MSTRYVRSCQWCTILWQLVPPLTVDCDDGGSWSAPHVVCSALPHRRLLFQTLFRIALQYRAFEWSFSDPQHTADWLGVGVGCACERGLGLGLELGPGLRQKLRLGLMLR